MIFHNPSNKKHVYSVSSVLTNDLCLAGVHCTVCVPTCDLLYVYQVYSVFLPVTCVYQVYSVFLLATCVYLVCSVCSYL